MMLRVVCVFVIQGLLAAAYPTPGDADADGPALALVEGQAGFSGVVPATGSVTILGNTGCPQFIPSNPATLTNVEAFVQGDEEEVPGCDACSINTDNVDNYYTGSELLPDLEASPYYENDCMDDLSKRVLLGSIVAESIIGRNEAEIEEKLAEIDSFVDSELAKTGSVVNAILENAAIPVIESLINSNLPEAESQLAIIEAIVESELQKVDHIVETILQNATTILEVEQVAAELLTDLGITPLETQMSSPADIDAELAEIDLLIESELVKIDCFIESELAKVDSFIEAELAKVDSFVETKLAIKQGLMDADFIGMKPYVDSDLATIEALLEPEIVFETEPEILDMPVQGVAEFSGIVPAVGKVVVFGNTGCPPLFPSNPPVVGNAESFIRNEVSLPISSHSSPARGLSSTPNSYKEDIVIHVDKLPAVNLNHENGVSVNDQGLTEGAVVQRNFPFSGRTRATGSATVFAHFGCAPLLPTEETPDGKKCIWCSKSPRNSVIPAPPRQSHRQPTIPVKPIQYPVDFPENVILDSSKNYERFIDHVAELDHEEIPVVGDISFEGVVPAFGSVSLRGHCA